jgi:hypothetical protein
MRYARHNHLAIIGASQRIADVHKLFTSGARKVVIFYTQEARDLIAVRDRWGSECEEMVANLRPLLYNDQSKITRQIPQAVVIEKGSQPKIYDFADRAYVSSGNAEEEIQCESDNDSEDDSARERGDVSKLQSSDSETQSAEGGISSSLPR